MELIIQLKSWLNLEPSIGCPNSCCYCFRHDDGLFNLKIPRPTISIKTLIKRLEKHPFFIPDITHLSISGTMSDAFLAQNKERTFSLLEHLDKKEYKNWITIVTKGEITENDAKRLKKLHNITPVIFVTYSEMPSSMEGVSNKQRIKTIKELKKQGIKVVIYWRPLIKGFNTSKKQIKKILNIGEKYADAFVLSGLRISENIKDYMKSKGLNLPKEEWDSDHKIISKGIKEKIFHLYKENKCNKPLFFKSSCAVSFLEKMPDFNAHWSKPNKNCSPYCPKDQRERCELQTNKKIPKEIMAKIPNLSREEKTFYKQKYRLPVE